MRKVVHKVTGMHGWFHGFYLFHGNTQAIIEFGNGNIEEFFLSEIKFESQPAESNTVDGQALFTTKANTPLRSAEAVH